ncbi:MAG: ABC transporter substrate-binding protein [Anaerolineae bacterium]
MNNRSGKLGITLFMITLIAACTPGAATTEPIAITIQLGTTHQAVYAGFYAADQNGYYTDEGLKVNFLSGGTDIDIGARVLDGTAQFAVIGASTLIVDRANARPLRAVATILRRDPVAFFSLAESGIIRLQDFVGKRIQVNARLRPRLLAMLAHAGIDENEITLVSTGTYTDLYSGAIDVASGLVTSSALAAKRAGHTLNIVYPDDYGVHFYSTVIFSTDDFIANNPDLVLRVLRASFQGWEFAVENPQATGAMVTKYNPAADADFEAASVAAMLPYINTGEDHIGWMKPEIWAGMLLTMQQQKEVTTALDPTKLYTMDFIQQIYGENNP